MRLSHVLLIVGIALAGLAATTLASAQHPARIGRLSPLSAEADAPNLEAFRKGLRELGWVEGRTVALETRFADGHADRLRALAADLVGRGVNLILTGSSAGALAAKSVTSTVPIVMVTTGDPVADGIVASLARPGGNVTGVTALGQVLNVKRLELIKEAVPGVTRVAVLVNPVSYYTPGIIRDRQKAAEALGLDVRIVEATGPAGYEKAFAAMEADRIRAVMVQTDPAFITDRRRIVEQAARHRIPAVYGEREFVDAGGLMFYGASLATMYRDAAVYVDKILKGARPADLPVEQPTKLELVINARTAKALGIAIPPAVLVRADQVVE